MRWILILALCFGANKAKADLWGGDIPLLIKIVTNTMRTYKQLRNQTSLLRKEVDGFDQTIRRLRTIQTLTRPEELRRWRDPRVAMQSLRTIYYTLPPQFRTQKSDEIERQVSRAMVLANRMMGTADESFRSGSELERNALRRGTSGVEAGKMAASGMGTMIKLQSQQQVAQATMVSLISQMIAEGAAKDAARVKSRSAFLESSHKSIGGFSQKIKLPGVKR